MANLNKNIFAYQSQRFLANFMQSLGLRRTRYMCDVSVTCLWRLHDECAANGAMSDAAAAIGQGIIFNCGVSTALVWRTHSVQISCCNSQSRYNCLPIPSVLLANLGLILCRSSTNIAGSTCKKLLKESSCSSRNSYP